MGFLADLDAAGRRMVLVHSQTPDMERLVRSRAPWTDGFLCVNERLQELVRAYLPAYEPTRVGVVPYPVLPPFAPPPKTPLAGRPLRIGFCGRLVRVQKRVDRLPLLCAELDRLGVRYGLELLGDGPDRPLLEKAFTGRAPVVFHGRKSGEDYWRLLDGWDAIVFVSDFEGTPIAMLEALSRGVIPLYPEIGSGGDAYVRHLRTDLLYPAWDLAQAATALARLSQMPASEVEDLRRRCQATVEGHLGESYIAHFCAFVQEINARPPIARDTFPRRPWPVEHLSLGNIARLAEWKRALLGWWRNRAT
jgi:glycosyltransferase involved in cell wall biosynthesis